MFQVMGEFEPKPALVPLTEEKALPPSTGDTCTDISFVRWKQGAVKMDYDPRKRTITDEKVTELHLP